MGKSSSRSNASDKADRKFEKKLEFYSKVRERVATLTAQKTITKKRLRSRQKKLKAYDLSSLKEILPEPNAAKENPAPVDLKVNCKSRRKIILKEATQLRAVLDTPAFQSDPLAAIHQHLQMTQPVVAEKPKRKDKNGEKKRNKKKGKKSKGSSGPQSMDM